MEASLAAQREQIAAARGAAQSATAALQAAEARHRDSIPSPSPSPSPSPTPTPTPHQVLKPLLCALPLWCRFMQALRLGVGVGVGLA